MSQSQPGTPRSRSRSRPKRSTTNLRDLRLAPLSSAFTETTPVDKQLPASTSPHRQYDDSSDAQFARQHSSYLQGKSAPTTPGILSRTTARKSHGGLSRRSSMYGDDVDYFENEAVGSGAGSQMDGGMHKAQSEAHLMASLQQLEQNQQRRARTPGPGAHHARSRTLDSDVSSKDTNKRDSWLSRTGAATSAMLQESKGQSWIVRRDKSTSRSQPESEDDDEDEDEQYEEMAALSVSTSKLRLAGSGDGASPTSARASGWGSRYGSRSASRRSSMHEAVHPRRRSDGFLNDPPLRALTTDPATSSQPFSSRAPSRAADTEIAQLTAARSFGLGAFVDSVMNFAFFRGADEDLDSDDDNDLTSSAPTPNPNESPSDAQTRMAAEAKRRREAKDRLLAQPPPAPIGAAASRATGADGVNAWQDVAWLLSVASKVLF